MKKTKQLFSIFMLSIVLFMAGCSNNAESSTSGEKQEGPTRLRLHSGIPWAEQLKKH